MLKEFLLKEPILKYPVPDQPYILYTDASKYAWAGVLTQSYQYRENEKEYYIHHPITYISGLFRGPQVNWVALTKEAYAIYMSVRKLDYYLKEADTTIRSDHLPMKSFLLKNTKNDKVNNWGVELALRYNLKFEYIKGIKNTLADTMSRLVKLDPDIQLEREPNGYQFGKPCVTFVLLLNKLLNFIYEDQLCLWTLYNIQIQIGVGKTEPRELIPQSREFLERSSYLVENPTLDLKREKKESVKGAHSSTRCK